MTTVYVSKREVRQLTTDTNQGIARNTFRAILTTYHLTDLVKSIFPTILVIPCNAIEEVLEENPLELIAKRKSAIGKKIVGPNYLRGLELFNKQFLHIKKFGVHLT